MAFDSSNLLKLTKMDIIDKLQKLAEIGYMVTIPANGNYICVIGFKGNHFKAKNRLSNTITAELNRFPFISVAWNKLSADGFYDFYAK